MPHRQQHRLWSLAVSRWSYAALIGILAAGCQQDRQPQGAELFGTHDLVQVGRLLFITSSDRHELRVLDLAPGDATQLDFVRAPNPIEPLGVPVVERPIGLARDISYRDDTREDGKVLTAGTELSGPYLYVRAGGSNEISVVAASARALAASEPNPPSEAPLAEVKRIDAVSAVTAMAGRAGQGSSTLYYATFDGKIGRLFEVSLVHSGLDAAAAVPREVLTAAAESIAAIAVLPGDALVLGFRGAGGKTGRTVVRSASGTERVLPFPGPVRDLVVQAGWIHDAPTGPGLHPGGQRVWGTLDEEKCDTCGGLLAIELGDATTPPAVAKDDTGNEMLPLRLGIGHPRSLTLTPLGTLPNPNLNPELAGQLVSQPVLGVGTSSSSEVWFFEAGLRLRHYDSPDVAQVTSLALDPLGAEASLIEGEALGAWGLKVADGKARDEVVEIAFEGVLPSLGRVPASALSGNRLTPGAPLTSVRVNDKVVSTSLVEGATCPDLVVTAVEPTALVLSGGAPSGCGGPYSVRASGDDPYVVAGGVTGYMGRTRVGAPFSFPGTRFHRPDGYQANAESDQLAFSGLPAATLQRGDVYRMLVASNFLPFGTYLDLEQSAGFQFPGAVTYDLALQSTFVAFPSRGRVMGLNSSAAVRGPTKNVQFYP
jgi:hypothetical protein